MMDLLWATQVRLSGRVRCLSAIMLFPRDALITMHTGINLITTVTISRIHLVCKWRSIFSVSCKCRVHVMNPFTCCWWRRIVNINITVVLVQMNKTRKHWVNIKNQPFGRQSDRIISRLRHSSRLGIWYLLFLVQKVLVACCFYYSCWFFEWQNKTQYWHSVKIKARLFLQVVVNNIHSVT